MTDLPSSTILDAVRLNAIALANDLNETPDKVVERANTYLAFLAGRPATQPELQPIAGKVEETEDAA